MIVQFHNRVEAGQLLARKMARYVGQPDVLVLALPRGGVPVAYEVAQWLEAPLDVYVVRKLGVPGNEELAMGAIASGGVRVMNEGVVKSLRISDEAMAAAVEREEHELDRREQIYRDNRPAIETRGRKVILVDDGIATGATMYAAIAALRQRKAARIIVATPTISRSTFNEMRRKVDDLAAVIVAKEFSGVGEWYEDFSQTTDEEVRSLLEKSVSMTHSH